MILPFLFLFLLFISIILVDINVTKYSVNNDTNKTMNEVFHNYVAVITENNETILVYINHMNPIQIDDQDQNEDQDQDHEHNIKPIYFARE